MHRTNQHAAVPMTLISSHMHSHDSQVGNPHEAKYRQVKKRNAAFDRRVGSGALSPVSVQIDRWMDVVCLPIATSSAQPCDAWIDGWMSCFADSYDAGGEGGG